MTDIIKPAEAGIYDNQATARLQLFYKKHEAFRRLSRHRKFRTVGRS